MGPATQPCFLAIATQVFKEDLPAPPEWIAEWAGGPRRVVHPLHVTSQAPRPQLPNAGSACGTTSALFTMLERQAYQRQTAPYAHFRAFIRKRSPGGGYSLLTLNVSVGSHK